MATWLGGTAGSGCARFRSRSPFSVIVRQVLHRGKPIWLLPASLGHAFVDLMALGLKQLLGQGPTTLLAIEGGRVFGLLAVWIIGPLPDQPVQPVTFTPSPTLDHLGAV
jgi:hypothetical protein